jgi:hypothetical protein
MPDVLTLRGLSRPCRPHGTRAGAPRCGRPPVSMTRRLILFRTDDEITRSCVFEDSLTIRVNVPGSGLLVVHEGNRRRNPARTLSERLAGATSPAGELRLYLRIVVLLPVFGMNPRRRIATVVVSERSPSRCRFSDPENRFFQLSRSCCRRCSGGLCDPFQIPSTRPGRDSDPASGSSGAVLPGIMSGVVAGIRGERIADLLYLVVGPYDWSDAFDRSSIDSGLGSYRRSRKNRRQKCDSRVETTVNGAAPGPLGGRVVSSVSSRTIPSAVRLASRRSNHGCCSRAPHKSTPYRCRS